MKIAVAGLGYVGTSIAILLARHNTVIAVDIDPQRIAALNARRAPITDPECQVYLNQHSLDLRATADPQDAYAGADFVIIATERVSTGFVESTVNTVVGKRFGKRQQMRWSKRGAYLMLQTRTRVLNGTLRTKFEQGIRR